MAFHENLFPHTRQRALSGFLDLVPPGDGVLVEVGSWEGRSTILIARHFPSEPLHVVDDWRNGDAPDAFTQLTVERDVYADFEINCKEAGILDRLVVHRENWRETFAEWTLPIRMIFIDAQHTYREVADNIRAVLPFMVHNGVLCGDDHNHRSVARAVEEFLGPPQVRSAVWCARVAW